MVKRFIPILCSVACSFILASAQETPAAAFPFKDADKINELGFNILKDISQKDSGNIAISPLSLRSVFLPIQKATAGNTLEQINHAMGHADGFNAIYDHYSHHPNINIANLMAVDQDIPLLPSFKKSIPDSWFQICDFKNNPQQEQKRLAQWIHQNTDSLINNLPPADSIGQETRLVALSAAVFHGKWQYPFKKDVTATESFYTENGKKDVQMMYSSLESTVIKGPAESTIIQLPYKRSIISMVIILPDKWSKLNDFLFSVQWEKLSDSFKAYKNISRNTLNVRMPKFSIKGKNMPLIPSLEKCGITDLFSRQQSDFSRMNSTERLYCDSIFQQCLIEVNEEETKVVATTSIAIIPSSIEIIDVEEIWIDRPFLWFIYDHEFDLILFCGTYTGPDE